MNDRQRLILKVCAFAICAMTLYPPYQLVGRGMGYHFIFTGPDHHFATINGVLLLVQWIGVCLIGGIAYLLARGSDDNTVSWILSSPAAKLGALLLVFCMRGIRAIALIYAAVGGLGLLVDLLKLTTYDVFSSVDLGKMGALLLAKVFGLTVVVGIAVGLRALINKIHSAHTGASSPLLSSWRSL